MGLELGLLVHLHQEVRPQGFDGLLRVRTRLGRLDLVLHRGESIDRDLLLTVEDPDPRVPPQPGLDLRKMPGDDVGQLGVNSL